MRIAHGSIPLLVFLAVAVPVMSIGQDKDPKTQFVEAFGKSKPGQKIAAVVLPDGWSKNAVVKVIPKGEYWSIHKEAGTTVFGIYPESSKKDANGEEWGYVILKVNRRELTEMQLLDAFRGEKSLTDLRLMEYELAHPDRGTPTWVGPRDDPGSKFVEAFAKAKAGQKVAEVVLPANWSKNALVTVITTGQQNGDWTIWTAPGTTVLLITPDYTKEAEDAGDLGCVLLKVNRPDVSVKQLLDAFAGEKTLSDLKLVEFQTGLPRSRELIYVGPPREKDSK